MIEDGWANKSVEFFRRLLGGSNVPLVITDALAPDHPIVFVNDAFQKTTGYSSAESLGRNCRYLQGGDRGQPVLEALRHASKEGEPCECVVRNYRKDGTPFWNQLYVYPVRDEFDVITHFVGIQHDVTAAHEARLAWLRTAAHASQAIATVPQPQSAPASSERNGSDRPANVATVSTVRDFTDKALAIATAASLDHKLTEVLNSITEGCFSLDCAWRMTYINDQGAQWLGRCREDLMGNNIWAEFPDAIGGVFYRTYQQAMSTRAYAQCDEYYPPVGRWFNARAYPSEEGLTVFFLDVSDRKRNEQRLVYAASHDQLTGLMNRDTCLQRLEDALSATTARHGGIAVLFIDLDKFKEVNDALGHRAGDHLLRLLSQRLKALAIESRYCARNSGDEFLFVLDSSSAAQAHAFARRLLEQIVKPFEVSGRRLTIGASIGIAVAAEDDVISASDLVNHADTAMYAAKASGRLAIRVFSADADNDSRRRLQLRNEMPQAIETGQFVLHYQPQIRLADGAIEGVEALVRWKHPAYGLLSPAAFLDIAEESPLILKLGAWVCEEACRQLACWQALGHRMQVAINVSARQLVDPKFPDIIRQSIRTHGVEPQSVELEITESMLAQDLQVSSEVLTQLVGEGFRVALDDFGTGFSSLAYIHRFPVTTIKIDRSFVTNIERDPKAMDLIKGIVALAKSLGFGVICEGIETPAQRRALETTQCDVIQGYLISKPLPAEELLTMFLERRGTAF